MNRFEPTFQFSIKKEIKRARVLRIALPVMEVLLALSLASCTPQKVKVYPAPEGVDLSAKFEVVVEGQSVPVYKTKVPPRQPIPRLSGFTGEFGYASFASFDMNVRVKVTVNCKELIDSVKILPSSYSVIPEVQGSSLSFWVEQPGKITVEINGDWHESLHIFANPFETDIPDPNDPKVVYFGPGVHEITSLEIGDNTTVYLDGGAYLRCIARPEDQQVEMSGKMRYPPSFILKGKNITFRGRGIIEQSTINRKNRRYTILIPDAENVTLEGITILDPSHWTVPLKRSKQVHIDNIKIFGWRGNADGVDISSSKNVLVENCFMRTFDDLVVVKSRTGQGEASDIHVRNCVLWNEIAHALSIGAEIRENISRVLFEDCDVIHDVGRETALRVYHCDDAVVSDITFQNIRVEEARRLISCWIGKTRWTKTPERGHIKNVVFKNIIATSAPIDTTLTGFQDGSDWKPYIIREHASMELVGFDESHIVEGVTFDNVILDGKKVTAKDVTMNEFVKDIQFK